MKVCVSNWSDVSRFRIVSVLMEIILNGKQRDIEDSSTVSCLLESLQLQGNIAVEINESIVPRSQFDSHIIYPGDKIEIVHAIGGG